MPPQAAHLEQIGKIAVEQEGQPQIHGAVAVVADRETLIGSVAQEENGANDVHRVFRQHQMVLEIGIRVCEVDGEQRAVVAHVRSQRQRLRAIEQEFQVREESRVAMKQAVRPAGRGADVAVAIEHDERIVVFQNVTRP